MSVLRLVAENPFRVLGVYANSPKKEIVANKGKATAFLKVGKSVEYPLDLNGMLPPLNRTIEMFNEAEAHLAIAKEQIQYAQFWFLKMTPLDDVAFNHLIAGDMAMAKDIWSKQENLSSLQNKMVCYLIEGYNEYALTEAEKLYERFGDEYIGKIDAHSTLQMTGTELLHQLIDLLGAEVGMQSLWECELEGETRDYIGRQTVEPLINKISAEIDKAHNVDRQNANARLNAAKKLAATTNEPLTQLKGIIGGNDPQYQIIADKLGLEILQCGIDYFNNSGDDDAPQTAMKIQTYAQSIVVGNLAKQRCNENVKILQKIINDLPPQSVLAEDRAIKAALEKYNNQPDEISYALTLLNTTKPHLQVIRERLGIRSDYYLKMSTLVVRAALHNVVEEVNNIQEQVAKRASIGLADDDDILEVTKTVYKGWNAITVMDEFHLEDDFQSHYNKNRSSLKSMCDQLGLSSFTTPSRSTTTSSTNSRTTSRPTSSYVNSRTSSRPSSYSTNSRTSYSGSSSSSSYNKKTNTSSEDKYLVASVVIVEIIWLIIGIANDDRYNPWWQNFLIGGVGLWLFPINYIPMAIINWLLTKLLDD